MKLIFIGIQAGEEVFCISCGEDRFGDSVVSLIEQTGNQGTFFQAVHIGSHQEAHATCKGCDVPMRGED